MRFPTAFTSVAASTAVLVMGLMVPPATSAAAVPSTQARAQGGTGSTEEVNPHFFFAIQPSGCRIQLHWGVRVDGRHAVYWLAESYLQAESSRPSSYTRSYGHVMEGDRLFPSGDAADRGRAWAEGSVDGVLAPHYYNAFGWAHSCPGESSRVLATVELEPYRSYPKGFPSTLVYKGTITAGPDAEEPLYRWLRHTGGAFDDVGNYDRGAWERASFPGPARRLEVTDSKHLADVGDVDSSGRMLEIDLDGDEETTGDRMTTGWIHGYR